VVACARSFADALPLSLSLSLPRTRGTAWWSAAAALAGQVTSAVATTAADFEQEQARFIAEQHAVAATAHVAPAPARTRPPSACTLCAQCACVPSVPVCLCVAHAPARTYPLRLCLVCLCVLRLRALAHGWGRAQRRRGRRGWAAPPRPRCATPSGPCHVTVGTSRWTRPRARPSPLN
jgi:hypothetical protein